jgi:hypothetical protein
MAPARPRAFTYELQSIIRNAPPHSGIFAIFAWETCVFVGEAADMCANLLALYDAANSFWTHAFFTHFTIELVASESRVKRQKERIRELGPVCNLGVGSLHCGDCSLASGRNPGGWGRAPAACTPCAARHDPRDRAAGDNGPSAGGSRDHRPGPRGDLGQRNAWAGAQRPTGTPCERGAVRAALAGPG